MLLVAWYAAARLSRVFISQFQPTVGSIGSIFICGFSSAEANVIMCSMPFYVLELFGSCSRTRWLVVSSLLFGFWTFVLIV